MTRPVRVYPDEPSGPFPVPPATFEDREGRDIELHAAAADDLDAIAEMYVAFDSADRAQGIPPTGESAVREWLDTVLAEGPDVVACHEEAVVGHATLVAAPDTPERLADDEAAPDDAAELAIFVLQGYQGAGIGRRLLGTTLGHGVAAGFDRVWLTVERWNHAAVGLYESVGFERSGTDRFELEMAIRVRTDGDAPPVTDATDGQTDSTG
jgi:ribosomal protein S18 acetylase RimI-like enzyme